MFIFIFLFIYLYICSFILYIYISDCIRIFHPSGVGSGHLLDAIAGEAEPRADQPTLHPRVQQRDPAHLGGNPGDTTRQFLKI